MSTTQYDKIFVDSLIAFAYEENSIDFIIKLRNQAMQKLGSNASEFGGDSSLVSANLQGKSFSFRVERPASQLFYECTEAIRQYKYGTVTSTTIDWWGYGYFPWT